MFHLDNVTKKYSRRGVELTAIQSESLTIADRIVRRHRRSQR